MSRRADRPIVSGPYETEQQGRTDVADVYKRSRNSLLRSALKVSQVALSLICQQALVRLGP